MCRRLKNLVPGAGNLVHMPAHIYIRTRKYYEGSLANEKAIKSDKEYLSHCHQADFYPQVIILIIIISFGPLQQ